MSTSTAAVATSRPAHSLCHAQRRSYTSPHLVRTRSRDSSVDPRIQSHAISEEQEVPTQAQVTSTKAKVMAHWPRKTQSFTEGVEPLAGERLTDTAVFLGGSCNPTTWRREVAVPLLEAARVSYYNPQVDEWFDELMQIEARAKETAQIVLMVVDALTRSIVCINEAVEYICRGRNVVLVVEDLVEGTEVAGKPLAPTELADLNGARQCLRDLANKRGVGLFPDVASAIQGCVAWLTQSEPPRSQPEMPRLRKRSSIVLNNWSGKHRLRRGPSRSYSSRLLKSHSSGCSTTKSGSGDEEPNAESPLHALAGRRGCQMFSAYTGGSVFLGGNLTATSWRQKVAIPLLHTAGIPVYVPHADYLSFGLSTETEKHVQALEDHWQEIETEKELAELILFVIPSNLRAIAAMTEAVELVSCHQALLLVIEPLTEGGMVEDGVEICGREFQDLARARSYLREMAVRNDVDVFDSVPEAVESIVERLE